MIVGALVGLIAVAILTIVLQVHLHPFRELAWDRWGPFCAIIVALSALIGGAL